MTWSNEPCGSVSTVILLWRVLVLFTCCNVLDASGFCSMRSNLVRIV